MCSLLYTRTLFSLIFINLVDSKGQVEFPPNMKFYMDIFETKISLYDSNPNFQMEKYSIFEEDILGTAVRKKREVFQMSTMLLSVSH